MQLSRRINQLLYDLQYPIDDLLLIESWILSLSVKRQHIIFLFLCGYNQQEIACQCHMHQSNISRNIYKLRAYLIKVGI